MQQQSKQFDTFSCCSPKNSKLFLEYLKQNPEFASSRNEIGFTPLHSAVYHKSKECFDELIRLGVNINVQDNEGNTPLYVACWVESPEFVKLLLEKGGDPNIQNKYGYTPLHCSGVEFLEPKSRKCIKVLLSGGANPDIISNDGRTYLDIRKDFMKEIRGNDEFRQ